VALLGRDLGFGEGNFQALYDSIELDQGSRRCEAKPSRSRVLWTL
jgi:4-hydroxyphenylpyruvate dioxygenase-like putative hemolysin